MVTAFVVLIIAGILIFFSFRKKDSGLYITEEKKPSYHTPIKFPTIKKPPVKKTPATTANITKNPIIDESIKDCFDTSRFITPKNNFKFPRYKSKKNALVKILDITDYKDFWSNLDAEEKRSFTLTDFEQEIDGFIEFEVEEFRYFIQRLNSSNLKPYEFIKEDAEELLSLYEEVFLLKDKKPYLLQNSQLIKILYDNGFLSKYNFSNDQASEEQRFYEEYLSSLYITELKDLTKTLKLKTSLKKELLVKQLIENIDFNVLPSPLVTNNKFDEMIDYFGEKYISDIKKQIVDWHPFYKSVVWDTVEMNITDTPFLKETIDNITDESYAVERQYLKAKKSQ